ncbi:hypothetical protein CLW00_112111 [Mongoliibacter ruber]|uniref:Uncharacterized protein n=1 Tax=Mongoliibacter ruber TaxID=1750599 RepID=A0A2T0WFP1_9BACT|nr:hypothetical protein CLW00_112111 [Mongoliibacter ruber]
MIQNVIVMVNSRLQAIPTRKLIKSRKILLAIMFIPALLILIYGYFILFSELQNQLLKVMLPLIIIGGIFIPVLELGQINAELKRRKRV